MSRHAIAIAIAGLCLMAPQMPSAHVTLETQQAEANNAYKAVLRVGHGCEGKPTIAIRVQIPEGVIAAKPMPKPGWQLEVVKGKYEQPYDYFDSELTEGVRQIAWSGGELPDDFYDEFVFVGRLTDFAPGTVLISRPCRSARAGCIVGSRSRRRAGSGRAGRAGPAARDHQGRRRRLNPRPEDGSPSSGCGSSCRLRP